MTTRAPHDLSRYCDFLNSPDDLLWYLDNRATGPDPREFQTRTDAIKAAIKDGLLIMAIDEEQQR
jgi:hypothetical protein